MKIYSILYCYYLPPPEQDDGEELTDLEDPLDELRCKRNQPNQNKETSFSFYFVSSIEKPADRDVA
jgi:hypothetical protein